MILPSPPKSPEPNVMCPVRVLFLLNTVRNTRIISHTVFTMPTRVEGSLKPEKPPGMASIVLALIVLPGSVVTSCIMIGIAVVKRQAVSYTYAKISVIRVNEHSGYV